MTRNVMEVESEEASRVQTLMGTPVIGYHIRPFASLVTDWCVELTLAHSRMVLQGGSCRSAFVAQQREAG